MTGQEYIDSIRDDREVWVYRERVTRDRLTVPTDTGNGGVTHPFFRSPHCVDDLLADRRAIETWARMSYGWMGRSPDYKATSLGTLGANTEFYAPFEDNARRWYRESQEKVLYWNHAIINPPVDRNLPPTRWAITTLRF